MLVSILLLEVFAVALIHANTKGPQSLSANSSGSSQPAPGVQTPNRPKNYINHTTTEVRSRPRELGIPPPQPPKTAIRFPTESSAVVHSTQKYVHVTAETTTVESVTVANVNETSEGEVDIKIIINPRKTATSCPSDMTVDAYGKCVPKFSD